MDKYECVAYVYRYPKILEYHLKDSRGKVIKVKADDLKAVMRVFEGCVTNLKLNGKGNIAIPGGAEAGANARIKCIRLAPRGITDLRKLKGREAFETAVEILEDTVEKEVDATAVGKWAIKHALYALKYLNNLKDDDAYNAYK